MLILRKWHLPNRPRGCCSITITRAQPDKPYMQMSYVEDEGEGKRHKLFEISYVGRQNDLLRVFSVAARAGGANSKKMGWEACT